MIVLQVFEYHQALGLLPVPELEQRALTLRKQQSLDQVKVQLLFTVNGCFVYQQIYYPKKLYLQITALLSRYSLNTGDISSKTNTWPFLTLSLRNGPIVSFGTNVPCIINQQLRYTKTAAVYYGAMEVYYLYNAALLSIDSFLSNNSFTLTIKSFLTPHYFHILSALLFPNAAL